MTQQLPTSPPPPSDPTFGEMLEEVIDLSTGVGVALLPLLVLAVPSVVLFVLLPALLLLVLAAPLIVIGGVIAGLYLLTRRLRRRRRRGSRSSMFGRAGGSVSTLSSSHS